MAEDVTTEFDQEQKSSTPDLVEIYDIFLNDGTHLRFSSDSGDGDYVDFEPG
jgi:hypothetical protein